ncbi:hypothetical protein JQX13_09625 [Archangium violaceum]|uniref:hypothetical protein n=1 Tax=Archangium violaceum TaxID=83451 RepID=UPI00193C545A|nr:hypothetical protein [Archangium violaceum]QRK10320.1 hypothetical protein JQX13_09625 [Archangium violaceum]
MGRTYSFEPFLSQQPAQVFKGSGPRLGNDEHKIALTKDEEKDTLPKAPTEYGQAHAETVKRYKARAQARKRSATKTATQARPAAKKAKTERAPARKTAAKAATPKAATSRTAAPKTPARQPAEVAETSRTPARKKVSATGLVGTIGRKVVTRAAAAAKKTVARAVKTATTRKPTKKR